MTTPQAIQKLGDSVILQVFARIMTILAPFVITLIAWLASAWLEGEFEKVRDTNALLAARVSVIEAGRQDNSRLIDDLRRQVAIIETARDADREALRRWQAETSTKLDRLLDSNTELTAAVSGLTATLQALQREAERGN